MTTKKYGCRPMFLVFSTLSLLCGPEAASAASAPTFPKAIGIVWGFGATHPAVRIDVSTGQVEPLGDTGFIGLNSLARSPSGLIYSVGTAPSSSHVSLVQIDPLTGRGTEAAVFQDEKGRVREVGALAFSPDGRLFGINGGSPSLSDELFTVDVATGVLRFLGFINYNVAGLDFGPDGSLYGWGSTVGLLAIDTQTARTVRIAPRTNYSQPIASLAFSPSGELFGITGEFYGIDLPSGVPTLKQVFQPVTDVRGFVFLPEPSTATMVVLEMLAIAFDARRWPVRRRSPSFWRNHRLLLGRRVLAVSPTPCRSTRRSSCVGLQRTR